MWQEIYISTFFYSKKKKQTTFITGLLYNLFYDKKFGPGDFVKLVMTAGKKDNVIRSFNYVANSEQAESFNNYLQQPSVQEVMKIRDKVIEKGETDPYLMDAAQWWQQQTARAEQGRNFQNNFIKETDEIVSSLKLQASLYFYIALLIVLTILTIVVISANNVVKKIVAPIKTSGELSLKVGSGVAQILTSISETSTTIAETAAAISETTTTSEELKQTAELSVEKAQDVLDLSTQAADVIKESELSLQNTQEGMNRIQQGMMTISESIVKLSEHSRAIGEIINAVNDLAEQSNLLAVNASIEAAKAGEQGKGFAVVAQEVRSLASQSKQATIQVRTLLNDIQNATNVTAMASEQGSKAVSNGVMQSQETTKSIHLLATQVNKMAGAATQINSSCKQQLIGVSQVTEAMRQIKEATDQNTQVIKEIENAVESLNFASQQLKELVDKNRV